MAKQFSKGDVVVLKSGGPAMTITGGGKDCDHAVTWFDEEDKQQFSQFDDEVLESIDDEDEDDE
jgi:uncharacterized protein YodC (DUF2158 family)